MNKEKKISPIPFIIGGIILVACVLGSVYYLTHTEQINPTFIYELGDPVPNDMTLYVKGSSHAIRDGELHLENVDPLVVGEYVAWLDVRKKHYEYQITVQDTVAPTINLNSTPEINVGISYYASDFYKGATDLSGEVETHFYIDGAETADLLFSQIGEHEVYITAEDINGNHSEVKIPFAAIDTIAPVIVPLEEYGYYATGRTYDIQSFIVDVTDNSSDYSYTSTLNGIATDEFVFNDCGTYDIGVTATDGAGNTSNYSVTVNADEAPILYGLPTDLSSPILFVSGDDLNVYEGIIAWDNESGFITDAITCVELDTGVGEDGKSPIYLATLQVTDEHGLTTEVSLRYDQVNKKNYKNTERYYPDELIDKMLAADAFNYELLTEKDTDALKELIWPCQIAMENSHMRCSGFIYKIDPDYIYIATSGHCIGKKNRFDDFSLFVYNPTTDTQLKNKSNQLELSHRKATDITYTYSKANDIAMIKITRDQIPNQYLVYLKEVNKTNESNPSYDQGIYTYAMYVKKGCLTNIFEKKYNPFTHSKDENYQFILDKYSEYTNTAIWVLTNEIPVAGQSGSAIFDNYGNPIAITTGYVYYRTSGGTYNYGRHVKIDGLKALYDKLSQPE